VGVWVAYHRMYGVARRDILRVESFTPGAGAVLWEPAMVANTKEAGGGTEPGEVINRAALTWRFNVDVAARGADGKIKTEAVAGTIKPLVMGAWTWVDERTLTFVPKEGPGGGWAKATEYKVSLPERLASPEGFTLGESFAATVRTPGLKVEGIRQIAFDDQGQMVLELTFNDKVAASEVLKNLTVRGPFTTSKQILPVEGWRAGRGAAERRTVAGVVKVHLHGQPAEGGGNVVRVITEPVEALREVGEGYFEVTLEQGLTGTSGPLGLTDKIVQRVEIGGRLLATEISADTPSQGDSTVKVRFNNAIDVEKIKGLFSVEPPVVEAKGGNAITYLSGWSREELRLKGPFVCGTRYTIKIARSAVDKPTEYPRPTTLSVAVPDRSPGVWVEHNEGYLGSQGNRTLLAGAVNVQAVRVAITRMYENNVVVWRSMRRARYYGSAVSGMQRFARPMVSKVIKVEGKKNEPQELRLNLDELLGAENARDGVYAVSVRPAESGQEDEEEEYDGGTDSALVTLSDIGLTAKQTHDGVLVWAVSLSTGKPLARVALRVYSEKNQLLGQAITDEDGVAKVGPL
ncbi:MAG: hypothetical protein WCI73_19670, partial [Phycisphaerae bacterium]